MKKYYNKKIVIGGIGLLILAFILDTGLNIFGYKGFLYFQSVYNKGTNQQSYGQYSPRTFVTIYYGSLFVYNFNAFKKIKNFQESNRAKLIFNTFIMFGITIMVIGVIDLVNVIYFFLG